MHPIESLLYTLPTPHRTRKTPLRILALGLSRSGTESLSVALAHLGYTNVYHGYVSATSQPFDMQRWTQLYRRKYGSTNTERGDCVITAAEFDDIIGDCEAVTDAPCSGFAAELVAAYPDAKVVLNYRDVDGWYKSFDDTFLQWHYGWRGWMSWLWSWFCAELYWVQRCKEYQIEAFFYGDFRNTGKWAYRQHVAVLKGLVPAERLLVWGVEDGWEPLCAFLSKEVPGGGFPTGNMSQDFAARVAGILEAWHRRAVVNMSLVAAVALALVVGVLCWQKAL